MTTMHTVGHGTLPASGLVAVLQEAGVRHVVDVRAYPGSRHNPQHGQQEMEQWLPAAGIHYRWMSSLGGRRRPSSDSKHVALRHTSFRAYADHMETSEFLDGVDQLLGPASSEPTALMCSEAVWWRCHRRLIADHLALVRDVPVLHLMHDGRVGPHVPTNGVRAVDGALVYDVGGTPQLPM